MISRTYQKVSFGDLPPDAQEMLTKHLHIDFSSCVMKAPRWFSAWSRNDKGHINGILAAEFQTWFEAKISVLVLDPRCLSRRVLRAIFTALFSQAKRLTAEVEPDNVRSLRQVQRLGFQFEGHHPLGLEGTRDTVIFGMLKDECPWLRSYVPPSASELDLRSVRRREPVFLPDNAAASRVRSNREHLSNGKFRHLVALAALIIGVVGAFSNILAASGPSQMLGINAARSSTAMRGVFSPFRLAVCEPTDDAMHLACGKALVSHLWIASGIDRERPDKAGICGVKQRGGEDVFSSHPLCIAGAQGLSQISQRLYYYG